MVVNNSNAGDVNITLRVALQNARKQLSKAEKDLSKFGANSKKHLQGYDEAVANVDKSTMRLQRSMTGMRKEFPAWALSTMFFGMQMTQTFRSIWMSSTKTFNDIMHSVEGTITSFDRLEGATSYLKFVAGQALEPLAEALLPIIDLVSDWIQANPVLFRSLMSVFAVSGAVMMGIGLMALNVNAVAGAITSIKGAALSVANWDWKALGNNIRKGIGVISIGFSIAKLSDAASKFDAGEWGRALFDTISAASLAYGGLRMFRGQGGGAFILLGLALDQASKGTFFTSLYTFIAPFTAIFTTLFDWIEFSFKNAIVSGAQNGIRGMIRAIIDSPLGHLILPGGMAVWGRAIDNILPKGPQFDFMESYSRNIAEMRGWGQGWDQIFNDAVDRNMRTDSSGGTTNNYNDININLVQQPGESGQDFVDRMWEATRTQ